jgi:DNA-binding PadR family transcriptional regulator
MATSDALLALLLPGPRHGYDLKRAHDEWFAGMRPLAFGQVYSTLARLQRDGLVQVAHTENGDGPERVVYELTKMGRERVLAWLAEPVDPAVAGAEELVRKTLAAYRLNADADGLMARQRAAHLRQMRALEPAGSLAARRPGSAPPEVAPALLADHARLHLDADLRWLEIAAARIQAQPPPGSRLPFDSMPVHDQHLEDPAEADEGARQ